MTNSPSALSASLAASLAAKAAPATTPPRPQDAPDGYQTIAWREGEGVVIIDQTLLPLEERYLRVETIGEMWEAIRLLRVRGAPAIGVAAAFGVWLGVAKSEAGSRAEFDRELSAGADFLRTSRPTAVNLFWAIDRMLRFAKERAALPPAAMRDALLAEAKAIRDEDEAACRRLGQLGAELVRDGDTILTHCNAGGLATARYGTALAIPFLAREAGKSLHVFADETRPLLQGARLTAWELTKAKIPCTLICDNMAASVLASGRVQAVFVGADRVAANGDAANKIGTYGVALAAREHGVPFYVVAPTTTLDLSIPSGREIPIEERAAEEVASFRSERSAPHGVNVFNPAFDVTPARFIAAIVTENGVCRAPYEDSLKKAAARA
jgi:methylthioribose-1-phosphate isomerase